MIRGGFLDPSIRADLIAQVRDGKAETRLTRRANALLSYKGRSCELTAAQQDALKSWLAQTLPRTTTVVGEWIEKSDGVSYSRSALIKLLRRNDMDYRKPELVPRKLDPAKQQAFINGYENLLNSLDDDEAVVFADVVHPTHGARPAGCWAPKDTKIALEGTSGRQRLNLHGAVDLETSATRMIEVTTVNAASTITLLMAIVMMYPTKRRIHVFLDNARYHHAVLVEKWLARQGCRIKLRFVPSYCPLWGLILLSHISLTNCY
jgi:transposase